VAVVGDAYIVVKAITTGFEGEVKRAASGINLERDGKNVGKTFSRGFNSGVGDNLARSFENFGAKALQSRAQFQSLVRTGYTLGPALSILTSSVGALGGGFVALAGTVAGAIPSLVVLPGLFSAIGLSALTAFAAFAGVGNAVSLGLKAAKKATADNTAAKIAAARRIEDIEKRIEKLLIEARREERDRIADMIEAEQEKTDAIAEAAADEEEAYAKLASVKEKNTESMIEANNRLKDAQIELTKALEDGREEIQQIGFDAEDAALSEKRASITLEKARETLQRTQDLPPNSRARREAQLAFAEAELGLRRAKDKNKDLQKEQDKLAGDPKNTQGYINALERQEDAQANVAQTARDALRSQQEAEANITAVKLENTQKILDAEKKIEDVRQRHADRQLDQIMQIQDAYDDLERAMEDQAKANQKNKAAVDAYADALKALSPAAREFVQYMVGTFIPSLKKIRDAVAETLLPAVQDGLERIRTQLFPALTPMMAKLGTSLGKAFNSIVDAIVNDKNIAKLGKVFEQAGYVVEGLGKTIANSYESILSILVGADPLIRKFTDFLQKKTAQFANFLDAKQASGELEKFFNKTGDIAAKWGEVLGNIFSGTFSTVKAIFAPGGAGDYILNWFTESTARFEKFSASAKGQNYLAQYFKDVAVNSRAVLGSLGAFVKEILKAGADPNIKVFWDTLKEAAPAFGDILKQANAAAPAFAKFVVALVEFTKVTLSTGAIQTFFDILRKALEFVTNIMSSPAMKDLFDFGAKIFAAFSAFGLIATVITFAVEVIAGAVLAFIAVFSKLGSAINIVKGAFFIFNLAFGAAAAPILAVVAAVTLLVAILIGAYNKSEIFREAVAKLVSALGDALMRAFNTIKEAIGEVGISFSGIGDILKKIGDFIGTYIVPIFQVLLVGAIDLLGEAIALVVRLFKGFWQILTGNPIEGLKTILGGLGTFLVNTFRNIWNNVKNALSNIPIFNSLLTGAQTIFRNIAALWNNTLGKIKFTTPSWLPLIGGKGFEFPKINLAEGGIIPATAGGTIARIGEAGRPERVEPLDPDGLSKRDRAMIQLLAGSSSSTGNTINVYPSQGMNESELASIISRQIAFQLRRGGA
jgi:hypothetical protein